jgi:hypothetical protein
MHTLILSTNPHPKMACNIPWQWNHLAFVRKLPLLLDVWNGNGHTTLCRSRCGNALQQLHMCQAIVTHSKAWKHDFMLPDRSGWLPHQNTIAELAAICYAVCWLTCLAMTRWKGKEVSQKHYHPEVVLITNSQRTQLRWLLHCNGDAVGPAYLWLTGTAKMPLEANTLKGGNSTHNK